MSFGIKPLGTRVVIKRIEAEEKTSKRYRTSGFSTGKTSDG